MNNYQYFKFIILSKLLRKGNSYIVQKMREMGGKNWRKHAYIQ